MHKLFAPVLILSLALAVPVSAQEKEKKKIGVLLAEREVIELILLRQKSVRDELKIDKEDAKKIFEFTHKQYEKAMEVHKLPAEEQNAKWEEMTKENDEFLHKAISPAQFKRLRQIAMQTAGLLFVVGPKISKDLDLSADQKADAMKAIKETQELTNAAMSAVKKEGRDEKLAAIRGASNEKLFKMLTNEQKTKWKEMVGEPFEGKLVFEDQEKK